MASLLLVMLNVIDVSPAKLAEPALPTSSVDVVGLDVNTLSVPPSGGDRQRGGRRSWGPPSPAAVALTLL